MTATPEPALLAVERRGTPSGPPVVLLHGFTQTARCWAPVDEALAADHDVVALDLPGHGASQHHRADLAATAGLVASTVRQTVGRPVTLVGYSMGGRVALHVALAHPDVVARLVLIGATPGIEDDDERAERRRRDEALADRIEAIGVPVFLDEWLAQPLFAGLDSASSHRAERERNTAAGLASSLRLAGTGTQVPLWDRLGEMTVPVLLVSGADDTKFTAIAEAMVPLLGGPVPHVVVPGAGHTTHLERPDAVIPLLR